MCTNLEGNTIPCGEPEDYFISICQPELDHKIAAVYDAYPLLRL